MSRTLSEPETAYIFDHLKKCGIADEALLYELTDHLSILTEAELSTTASFDRAFAKALEKFNRKELLHIASHKKSFYAHPRFLNGSFLSALGCTSFILYCMGIYLRYRELPFGKLSHLVGHLSFAFIFLPFLLLYRLTDYTNKGKALLAFITMFTAFHACNGWLFRKPAAVIMSILFLLFSLTYVTLFIISPKMKKS